MKKKIRTEKKDMKPFKLITIFDISGKRIWNFVWWLVRIEWHKPAEIKKVQTNTHSIFTSPTSAIRDELTDLLYTYVFIANDFYLLLCLSVSVFGK